MKIIKVVILISLLLTTFTNVIAQKLQGKSYIGLVATACKEMENGGCSLTTYCILSFEENKVRVGYKYEASCTEKEKEAFYRKQSGLSNKIFDWSITNNAVDIKGFDDYGKLIFSENKLLGNSDRIFIEFNQVETK